MGYIPVPPNGFDLIGHLKGPLTEISDLHGISSPTHENDPSLVPTPKETLRWSYRASRFGQQRSLVNL